MTHPLKYEPTHPAMPGVRRKKSTSLRYVLPAAMFILVVAGIAWVTQFMPNSRSED